MNNPLVFWLIVILASAAVSAVVLAVLGFKLPPEQAEQVALRALSAADKTDAELMRLACIQKVRDAYHDGTIGQDAYEFITGNMRNIE